MATIEIYGPSSHSQTVAAPSTIVAVAAVTNFGNGWGWARMRITGTTTGTGSLTSIRPGLTLNVRATAPIATWMEGQTFTVSAHLEEMDSSNNRIRGMDSHINFRITVEDQFAFVQPWHWEVEEQEQEEQEQGPEPEEEDVISNGTGNGWESPEDIEDFEGGEFEDFDPSDGWDSFDDDEWFGA